MALDLALVLGGYLLGSVSFAIVASRLFGLADPRSYGSRNPGATNVLRAGHRAAAALTLAGDTAKGFLAVLAASLALGASAPASTTVALAGAAAFLGHLLPLWHRFRGGKGVATGAGVLLAFDAWLGLATLASFAAVLAFFRRVSLASVLAALFAAWYALWVFGLRPLTAVVAVMAALLVARHYDNIQRLVRGEEPRVGERVR